MHNIFTERGINGEMDQKSVNSVDKAISGDSLTDIDREEKGIRTNYIYML